MLKHHDLFMEQIILKRNIGQGGKNKPVKHAVNPGQIIANKNGNEMRSTHAYFEKGVKSEQFGTIDKIKRHDDQQHTGFEHEVQFDVKNRMAKGFGSQPQLKNKITKHD